MRITSTFSTAAIATALLAACGTTPPVTVVPGEPRLPPPSEDTCRAGTYASTLGQDYRQVPPAPQGRVFRVVCTTCAMTMDFNPERLNFFYDEANGKVVRLSCG
jgi:hypothetical protein